MQQEQEQGTKKHKSTKHKTPEDNEELEILS